MISQIKPRQMRRLSLMLLALATIALSAGAQSPVGTWKTVDDQSGVAKSHVEIYENNGQLYGKIVRLLQIDDDTLCDACEGDRHNQPVLGMVIMEELEPYKDYWKGGTILDPGSGNEYGCSVWFEDGKSNELRVRGKHWSGLYRTQTWYRVD